MAFNKSTPEENDPAHPERRLKDVFFVDRNGMASAEDLAKYKGRGRQVRRYLPENGGKIEELCWACGWTSYHQCCSSYEPRVKVFHTRGSMGLWSIGSQWLIRDQLNNQTLGADYMTQQFLRQHLGSGVPLVDMQRLSQPEDAVHLTLMSRAPGQTLWELWDTLTPEEKAGYSKQLVGYIKQWRRFTAPVPMKVDGTQLDDTLVAPCIRRQPPTCNKIGFTKDAWLASMADGLRHGLSVQLDTEDETVIEARLREIMHDFPSGEPFTLTHGDLTLHNIIAKDGQITAIIDWDMAGFHPWWAELFSAGDGTQQSCELFDPVWAELYPDKVSRRQMFHSVAPVADAYARCWFDHPDWNAYWSRPAFCECKKYGGDFACMDLGMPMGRHEMAR